MISTFADSERCRRLARGRREVVTLPDPGEVAVGKGGADEAELAGAAADIEDASAGHGDEEFRRFGGDADGSPLEGREFSNPGRIDLVELLVFDGPRILVLEVVFCLQHSVE